MRLLLPFTRKVPADVAVWHRYLMVDGVVTGRYWSRDRRLWWRKP